MRPKITYISPQSTSVSETLKFAEALAQGGAEMRIFSEPQNTDGFESTIARSKVPFTVFPKGRELPFVWRSDALNMLRMRLPSVAMLKALSCYSADLVVAGEPADLGIAWFAAKLHRAQLIYIPGEYYPGLSYGDPLTSRRYAHYESYFAPRIRSWISCGDKLTELYARQYVLDDRLHTVYGSVPRDTDRTPRGLRRRTGAREDNILVFYSGQVSKSRGLWDVLHALPKMPENVWFVVLGVGNLAPLRSEARDMGLAHRVHVLDAVPQDHLMGYTCEADIGVIPIHDVCVSYRYCNPTKFFDYIGAGLPMVVSSGLEQLKWYVETHQLGEVFQTGSSHALAKAIAKLVKDRTYRRRCAANVQRIHQTEACWEIQSEKLRTAVLGKGYRDQIAERAHPIPNFEN